MGMFDLGKTDPTTDDRTRVDPNDYLIAAFDNSVKEMADQSRIVMRELVQTYGKAAEYESFNVDLPVGQAEPSLLAGFDLSRMRMLVTASGPGVVMGHRSSVAVGAGYRLVANSSIELQAVGDIYIRNVSGTDSVNVSVWIEKSAQ